MRHTTLALVALLAALPALADTPQTASETTGWRVDNTGKFPDANPVTRWSPRTSVLWKTALPKWSNGTPVAIGDKLYFPAEPDKLLCASLATGEVLWTRSCPTPQSAQNLRTHRANGYSSATPVTDGKHLYVVYGSGMTVCFDLDGEIRWKRLVGTPQHRWGHSASPTLVGGVLVVHIQDGLFGLDAATGAPKWDTRSRHVWGTPAATRVGDVDVVVLANGEVRRVADGKLLAQGLGKLTYATPVVAGDVVFFIDPTAVAVRLEADGAGGVRATRLWQETLTSRRDRFYASAVVHDGLVYAVERRGTLYVLDARTGKPAYTRRLPLGRGTCYPSVVMAGNLLLAGSDNGTTVVFKPGRTYFEVATNALEQTRACPIFVGDKMIVRGYDHLYCIGRSASDAAPQPLKLKPGKSYYE